MKICMRFFVLLLPLILGCKKDESEKLALNISSTEWYTMTRTFNTTTFCEVHLKISGNTNAELLSILTFGDGLKGCGEIKCDANKNFSTDVMIRFFPIHAYPERKFGTVLTAYTSRTKPEIVFCDATGTGDTILRQLESPMLICN